MPPAQEVHDISPEILIWQAYDAEVKADLFSTALETNAGTYIVDPIPLAAEGMLNLRTRRKAAGVFVTNTNHLRATAEFAATFSIPAYANRQLREIPDFADVTWLEDGEVFSPGLAAVSIDGGPAGEMALHYNEDGGTMVVGDALINFEPHGFGLLPSKYCQNYKLMRQSLEKLLDHAFQRLLFAHGTPILSDARARLAQLLVATR
jgi:glyoxylase-like metal-dependent hydrolase (beta-lactamase superfamily II)